MKYNIIAVLIILVGFICFTILDCYQRYPYHVSRKIMELSNIKEQEKIVEKQLDHSCWDVGPEEFTYPEKTYMLDYNYYIVVEFKTNCDLGDSIGFYTKSYYTCDDGLFGCSIREYTYHAKVRKSQFKISLLDLIW